MKHLIIDTNVPLKAATVKPDDEIDRRCCLACLNFIKELMDSDDIVVLDRGKEILNEYRRNIDTSKEDSVSSQFLMWLLRRMLTGKVDLHEITKIGDNAYAEYPNSPQLEHFDRSDRKFVALANAHPQHPSIYNGSDTDWWDFREALEQVGIHVFFLCEEYMRTKSKSCS
ncbi:MAG: hypothetical protein IJ523_04600 [Succinivibrionaceae bacterium]|nr:hypothetical protein [Succinivibrionaceae bacterium]